MPAERLQKILSQTGVASRRQAEKIILEGRVTVNGAVVTELGSKADLASDHIKVDGRLVRAPKRLLYIALYKPDSVVTTLSDPQGRTTVVELLRGVKERVYPVGRLDYHSEGLLLLTNDGDLANGIMSAARHVAKTYLVKVKGRLEPEQEETFRTGVPISRPAHAALGIAAGPPGDNPWYEVRLLSRAEPADPHHVQALRPPGGKAAAGAHRAFELGPLKPGQFRYLSEEEVRQIAARPSADPARRG